MGLKAYDQDQVSVIFGGALIEGFVPGSKIKIGFPEWFGKTIGTNKEVARYKKADRTVMFTMELLQTSSSNDVLMAFLLADDAAPNGAPQFAMVKNLQGTFLVNAPGAWIVGPPAEVDFGEEVKGNVWKIDTGQAQAFVGGQVVRV